MTSLLPTPLVSTQWLADHLGSDDLVVLDATALLITAPFGGSTWLSGYDPYLIDGHIPRAVFADLLEEFSDQDGRFPFTLPDSDRVRDAAGAVGISADSRVVVYDTVNGRFAARLWWLLRSFDLASVAVLDGGFTAWKAAGLPVETGHVAASAVRTAFEPARLPGFWADKADVEAVLDGRDPATLVCSLPAADYRGEIVPSGRRAGHIPGSLNVPAALLVDRDSNLLRSGDALAARTAEIPTDGPVILYCAAGILASLGALALTAQGASDVRVYDGSRTEWSADPDAVLVTTTAS
ncbi:sulfurtransferase [Glaciibacter flavus]|uniref:Sulfurtransferase n=1 Tax=Orlajensenia flava TaxID=2565934 RepID=A0A4S4FZR0_9MICO|nr:rhodanese-like domain-containing protein [Glaciibacter flavus]THG36144.1 sulfurtransferase [Glaciibacter flavus]